MLPSFKDDPNTQRKTQAEIAAKRELIREMEDKKAKAQTKYNELTKGSEEDKDKQILKKEEKNAQLDQKVKANENNCEQVRSFIFSLNCTILEFLINHHGLQDKEKMKEELVKVKEQIRKLNTTKTGLERLMGFYANDKTQQSKARIELEQIKNQISTLRQKVGFPFSALSCIGLILIAINRRKK